MVPSTRSVYNQVAPFCTGSFSTTETVKIRTITLRCLWYAAKTHSRCALRLGYPINLPKQRAIQPAQPKLSPTKRPQLKAKHLGHSTTQCNVLRNCAAEAHRTFYAKHLAIFFASEALQVRLLFAGTEDSLELRSFCAPAVHHITHLRGYRVPQHQKNLFDESSDSV